MRCSSVSIVKFEHVTAGWVVHINIVLTAWAIQNWVSGAESPLKTCFSRPGRLSFSIKKLAGKY